MPYYEYQCQACATTFSEKRSFDQAHDPATCPECFSVFTKKTLTAVAHISNGGKPAASPSSIPMSMSSGGCGCGGSCACSA